MVEIEGILGGRKGKEQLYQRKNARFLIGDQLFEVPLSQFIAGSEDFTEKYKLRHVPVGTAQNVVVIDEEGVNESSFEALLKTLYPLPYHGSGSYSYNRDPYSRLKKNEWVSVLRLSVRWKFRDIRKLAIEHLESLLQDPVQNVVLGREACIAKWVCDGYHGIVEATSTPIRDEERKLLGDVVVARLQSAREEVVTEAPRWGGPADAPPNALLVVAKLSPYFNGELEDIRVNEAVYFTQKDIEEREYLLLLRRVRTREDEDEARTTCEESGREYKEMGEIKALDSAYETRTEAGRIAMMEEFRELERRIGRANRISCDLGD